MTPVETVDILVVEDDPDQRELIADAAASVGEGSVRAVGSAADCLAEDLAACDVVLLDYHLPDMSGLDLLEAILERRDLPVIFVTGENDAALAAEAIRRGAQDYLAKHGDYLLAIPVLIRKSLSQHRIRLENARLQRRLEEMLDELQEKNRQLESSLAQQEKMAATDCLTGLANRRHFGVELERTFAQAARQGFELTCCMCDVDRYKRLNDELGHQVGDDVLVLVADVIRGVLRTGDTAARYGGDEFVILLPYASVEQAASVCRRLADRLAERSGRHERLDRPVTLSIGIASTRAGETGAADDLVARADRALYRAKELGRNRIVRCDVQPNPLRASG